VKYRIRHSIDDYFYIESLDTTKWFAEWAHVTLTDTEAQARKLVARLHNAIIYDETLDTTNKV
jgi:hypothetical protein